MIKTLMLRKKLDKKNAELTNLRAKDAEFTQREADLETAIAEAETDEEQAAVEEEVNAFTAEKAAHEEAKGNLEAEVEQLEGELAAEEEAQRAAQAAAQQRAAAPAKNTRSEVSTMKTRNNFFTRMSMQEREAFVAREDMQAFLGEVRSAMKEKRAITNAGLLIPQVLIGLLRENIEDYSKLYNRCNLRRVPGTGRIVIEGAIPEGVWTEMCANLNELNLAFSQVEVDGYKVGGYFRICNAVLEDSDIDLADELITVLGQAIGFALDKAILYGTGTKMPVGVMTGIDAGNIVSHAASVTDKALVKALILDSGKTNSKYSRGEKTWVMNDTTRAALMANSLEVNAAGAIVAGINGAMPVVGGDIIVLNFVPDNVIIGGYFDLYLLAERAGTKIDTSEHAFWVADQTGFKGTARYDGKVLDGKAFVAIGINGKTPAAADVTFAEDTANA